jgi:hypothetical protein
MPASGFDRFASAAGWGRLVYLPKQIGISATASGGIGDISVTGLRKSGDRSVNDAYERAAVRIRLDIQGAR